MKLFFLGIVLLSLCGTSYASIRSDFNAISRERGLCNSISNNVENEFCDRFIQSVGSGNGDEIVAAYQNVRDVQRLFNQCWSLFGVAVMSLYNGETKFAVVPRSIGQIEEVKGMLVNRFPEMINAAEGYKDERLRSVMLQFLMESKRELLLVERYVDLLTKY